MKPSEIKALREANTIKEVVAMVDCREFEHNAKDEAAHIQYHLMLQYNNRILDGMPEAAALNHAKASAVHANGGTVAQQTEFWRLNPRFDGAFLNFGLEVSNNYLPES